LLALTLSAAWAEDAASKNAAAITPKPCLLVAKPNIPSNPCSIGRRR
jgi:hypothetical protein